MQVAAQGKCFSEWTEEDHASSYQVLQKIRSIWEGQGIDQFLVFGKLDVSSPMSFRWEIVPYHESWEKDGLVFHVVRFTVGTFKAKKSILAGYYVYPKGGKNLPAIVCSLTGSVSWVAATARAAESRALSMRALAETARV